MGGPSLGCSCGKWLQHAYPCWRLCLGRRWPACLGQHKGGCSRHCLQPLGVSLLPKAQHPGTWRHSTEAEEVRLGKSFRSSQQMQCEHC